MLFRRFRRNRRKDPSSTSFWEGTLNWPHIASEDLVELGNLYRMVFDTEFGHKVLTHILIELRFFEKESESQETMVMQNYAKRLLEMCGMWTSMNSLEVVKALFALPFRRVPPGAG